MDRFALLLNDLGLLIDLPLLPDHHRMCSLYINNAMHVQLKEEEVKEKILISSFITPLPPGRFQGIVLRELLKENNLFPRVGTFCYTPRNNQLAFFTYVSMQGLTGDLLADALEIFLDRAFSWKTGIETGQMPARGQNLLRTGPSVFNVKNPSNP